MAILVATSISSLRLVVVVELRYLILSVEWNGVDVSVVIHDENCSFCNWFLCDLRWYVDCFLDRFFAFSFYVQYYPEWGILVIDQLCSEC
jgi:hypothetical protein